MIYEDKKDKIVYIYDVTYDKEKLKEILKKLEKYGYKGLNELYKETLECFKFNLVAIKEYLDNQEIVSGLLLQKKK